MMWKEANRELVVEEKLFKAIKEVSKDIAMPLEDPQASIAILWKPLQSLALRVWKVWLENLVSCRKRMISLSCRIFLFYHPFFGAPIVASYVPGCDFHWEKGYKAWKNSITWVYWTDSTNLLSIDQIICRTVFLPIFQFYLYYFCLSLWCVL